MIRVLVVDDEPLVRLAIRSLEDWRAEGIEIAAEASDGREALAVLHSRSDIDIVLVDVDMPGINGLEFAETLKEQGDERGLLFLSSFDTFEYARRAFKAGAADYILKSEMDEGRLLAATLRLAERTESKPANGEQTREERSEHFIERLLAGDIEDAQNQAEGLSFRAHLPVVLMLLRPSDVRLVAERYGDDPSPLARVAGDLIRQCLLSRKSGEAYVVSFERYLAFFDSTEEADAFFGEFSRAARNYLAMDFEARVGPLVTTWAEVRESYAEAEGRFSVSSRLVVRARRYIREHYAEAHLDLAAIAAYAEVSKNHLSWEFARESGETITAFISRVRIEAAKKLLEETAMKTYEIADRVGFTNVETFYRAFKKITGTTPRGFSG